MKIDALTSSLFICEHGPWRAQQAKRLHRCDYCPSMLHASYIKYLPQNLFKIPAQIWADAYLKAKFFRWHPPAVFFSRNEWNPNSFPTSKWKLLALWCQVVCIILPFFDHHRYADGQIYRSQVGNSLQKNCQQYKQHHCDLYLHFHGYYHSFCCHTSWSNLHCLYR